MASPEPGIYRDVDPADYFAWDAVSNSRMGAMKKSPRHYKFAGNVAETSAMRLGSLVHNGRLEPMSIAERYAIMPAYELMPANVTRNGERSQSKTTVHYKTKAAEFSKANEGKQIVPRAEYMKMKLIVESLTLCELSNRAINGKGPIEVSMVWEDPETGLLCKGRIDKVNEDEGWLVDLKTSGNIFKFQRSIEDYGYARQLAHYQAGYAILTGELLEPWIVPVESVEPYCTMPAPVGAESIEAGEAERIELLTQIKDCQSSGVWPGPEPPREWQLSEWALNQQPVALTIGGASLEI